ncbi:hypothetical protein CH63R_14581 [Colletotrichum higginsianum IMI 349063]|uniref:Uncharacterized protein n=1 Tax=Colletotrichum higginsianum (strain IMI 349063) TaxID=759273 RepID=A0A1B7XQH5_COLHI|nr:hypothetical protein CH63R_14581 [Colletotrichum higginsianum IMI 349063]OBR02009.1 hypothetical protein CH63R_14581 [Colletotrichum higginsianum IMI 349063]
MTTAFAQIHSLQRQPAPTPDTPRICTVFGENPKLPNVPGGGDNGHRFGGLVWAVSGRFNVFASAPDAPAAALSAGDAEDEDDD